VKARLNKKLMAFLLTVSPAAYAGPMVGGGPNPNPATEIIKEFVRENGTVISSCTINTYPDQIYLIHSDRTSESAQSPIQKHELDARIHRAASEVEYRLPTASKKPYVIIYARNLKEQVSLYDSRPEVSRFRQGVASDSLMKTVEGLCAGLH
jgi:hypothetical protein